MKGSAAASDTEIDQPVFPPSANGPLPASSSTALDCSGDPVSFLAEDDQRSHVPTLDSEPTHADTQTTLQKLSSFAAPLIDASAAGLSLAAARLSAHPMAAKASGVASGALWVAGAAAYELGNAAPYSKVLSASNTFCGTAGALSVAAPLLLGQTQSNVAYSAAAAWAANGAADMVCATGNTYPNLPSRLLLGASGAANVTAAALSAASARASAEGQSIKAANLGTVSAALWGVGAAAALGAEWAARSDALNRPRQPGREWDSPV